MQTENLPVLKINKLTQAQYNTALANGEINENELYLVPDDTYTTGEINSALEGKADWGTSLADYKINDAYTKTSADQKFETIENVNALENQISQIEKSIPTSVSQLTNDSNYIIKDDVNASITAHNENPEAHNDIREEIVAVSDTIAGHMTNTANPHGVKLVQLGVEATATELNVLNGITASTAELNKLDGLNASTAELNKLKGATITTAELNTLEGIGTSPVASQLSAVADAAAAAQRSADASMSNIEVTGSGNAITAASYDSTT